MLHTVTTQQGTSMIYVTAEDYETANRTTRLEDAILLLEQHGIYYQLRGLAIVDSDGDLIAGVHNGEVSTERLLRWLGY